MHIIKNTLRQRRAVGTRLATPREVRKGNYACVGPGDPVPDASVWVRIEDFFVGTRVTLLNKESPRRAGRMLQGVLKISGLLST